MTACSERKKVAVLVSLIGVLVCCTISLTTLLFLRRENYDETSATKRIVETAKVLVSANVLSNMKLDVNPCDNFYEYCNGNFADNAFVDVYNEQRGALSLSKDEIQGIVPRLMNRIRESEKTCEYELKMATIFDSCINSSKNGGIDAAEIAKFVIDWYRNDTGFSLDLLDDEIDSAKMVFKMFPFFDYNFLEVSTLYFDVEYEDQKMLVSRGSDRKSKLPVNKEAQTILIGALKSIFKFDEVFEANLLRNVSIAIKELLQLSDAEMPNCCNGSCFRNNDTLYDHDFYTNGTSGDNDTCSEILKSEILKKIEIQISGTFPSISYSSIEFHENADVEYLYNLNSDRCFNDFVCFHTIHLFSLLHRSFLSSNLEYQKKFASGNYVTNCILPFVETPMFESLLANSHMRHYSGKEAYLTIDDLTENVKNSFLTILDNIEHADTREDIKKYISNMEIEPSIEHYFCTFNNARLDKLYIDPEDNFLVNQQKLHRFWKRTLHQGDLDYTGLFGQMETNAAYWGNEHIAVLFSFLISEFYMQANPLPMNYGFIGSVIGHEIGHSIDPNLLAELYAEKNNNTWDDVTNSNYQKFATCLREIYNNASINGSLTIGENFSDLFGTTAAFRAMKKKFTEFENVPSFDDYPGLNRFTPEQLFFISISQFYGTAYLDGSREKLPADDDMDPHSPRWARVNVLLSLVPEFADTFGCVPGDRMVLSHDCKLWL